MEGRGQKVPTLNKKWDWRRMFNEKDDNCLSNQTFSFSCGLLSHERSFFSLRPFCLLPSAFLAISVQKAVEEGALFGSVRLECWGFGY